MYRMLKLGSWVPDTIGPQVCFIFTAREASGIYETYEHLWVEYYQVALLRYFSATSTLPVLDVRSQIPFRQDKEPRLIPYGSSVYLTHSLH